MRSFYSEKGRTPFLTLDIEDDLVKSLILRKEGRKLAVLGSASEDSGNLESDLANSIKEAYKQFILFANRSERKLDNFPVLLGLPSSVLKARVIPLHLERVNNGPISKSEEIRVARDALRKIKKDIGDESAKESGILPSDIKYISFKVLEKSIDGYSVPSLYNKDGKDLFFKVMAVFIPKEDFKKINSTVENLGFKVAKVAHIAEALSDVSYKELENIRDLSKSLDKSHYVPSLLMSYYAREIL